MSLSHRSPSLFLATLVFAAGPAAAQDEKPECIDLADDTPPGLYVTVDQSQVYLIKDGKTVELNPGEAAYANETDLACIKVPPRVLDWPCGTAEALARPTAPGYTLDDLSVADRAGEVQRRYFEENQALSPPIEWLNGDIHGDFDAGELEQFNQTSYWYLPAEPGPLASPKRPKTQLVGLFWATKQAVLDRYTLDALRAQSADGAVPTVFVYNADNQVPVSFFGPDVTLRKLVDAYMERGIEVAPVPVWYAGDHHLKVSVAELDRFFELPALADIGPERVAALRQDLSAHGFSRKPIVVSVMAENRNVTIDQPDRVRVAASMGIEEIPVVVFYYTPTSHLADCGIALPQISAVGGATGDSAAPDIIPPPQLPDPERKASDS